MPFAELCITSNFTFLTGGSHPQEYALRAIELGLPAFAIADRNSVAGLVRAHQALREAARGGDTVPRLVPAARLCLAEDGPELTALPRDRAGWGRLCRVLSRGALRAAKGVLPAPGGRPRRPGRDAPPPASPARPLAPGLAAAAPAPSPGGTRRRIWWRAPATTARTGTGSSGRRGWPASSASARRFGRADHAPWRAPEAGGRADLHPRGAADRFDRPRRAGQRRAAAALRGGDAAALRRP